MLRYLFLTFGAIFAALAAMYFWIGVPRISPSLEELPESLAPHVYNIPERSLKHTQIAAFYFVPKNKVDAQDENWKALLEAGLEKLRAFHALQFQGFSDLTYAIYPEPVIGVEENLFYDTEVTQRGNPRALMSVAEEIEGRVFRPSGDLAIREFSAPPAHVYPVMLIMYEGVGAAGGVIHESELETVGEIAEALGLPEEIIFRVNVDSAGGFFLVNRDFLSEAFAPAGVTILAHEFYHTIGVPDGYDEESAVAETSDIMGLGRFKPLEKTYLKEDTLRQLGL